MEDYVRGYKYRIYPTQEQETKFNQMFGNARVVFNYFLGVRQDAWKNERRSVGYSETSRLLTELKRQPEFTWLNLSDSMSLQESLRDLDNGFQRFFAGDAKYPKFKSKHNAKNRIERGTRTITFESKETKFVYLESDSSKLNYQGFPTE